MLTLRSLSLSHYQVNRRHFVRSQFFLSLSRSLFLSLSSSELVPIAQIKTSLLLPPSRPFCGLTHSPCLSFSQLHLSFLLSSLIHFSLLFSSPFFSLFFFFISQPVVITPPFFSLHSSLLSCIEVIQEKTLFYHIHINAHNIHSPLHCYFSRPSFPSFFIHFPPFLSPFLPDNRTEPRKKLKKENKRFLIIIAHIFPSLSLFHSNTRPSHSYYCSY